jgi:hypothetical protein
MNEAEERASLRVAFMHPDLGIGELIRSLHRVKRNRHVMDI